ncbi:MAG: winged helix-turn-helix transcriptional regulator [Nanoarchaeota archaeon]|nr:winged helix-turn-helix transcriptional regulator [Nanoarchaeota archaeon]
MKTIDKTDKKIILELFRDGRMPVNKLARAIGISKEVALYRIKKLQKQEIIKQFIPIIDLSPTGINMYRLQLKFRTVSQEKLEKFNAYVKQIPQLSWMVNLQGQWDIVLLFWIKSVQEFKNIYDDIVHKFGSMFEEKLFTIVTSIEHYPPTYIIKAERKPLVTQCLEPGQIFCMDKNQLRILAELYGDARKPLQEIAKNLNVSISTVIYHMKILRQKKIIVGFRPVLGIDQLGYEHFKVTIQLNDPSQKKIFKEKLAINNNITYITESIGKYDLEFEAEYNKVNELLDFLENVKKDIGIKNFEIIFRNEEIVINEIPGSEE